MFHATNQQFIVQFKQSLAKANPCQNLVVQHQGR